MREARPALARQPRRRMGRVLAAAGMLLVLAACGGGSGPASPTTPTPPTVPLSSACATIATPSSGVPGASIVNGADCTGMTSAVVLLNMRDTSNQPLGSCSGTIVAPRAVLTAAHCIDSADIGSVRVYLGSGPEVVAQSFSGWPNYKENNPSTPDVAVVLMADDLPRTPIPLLLSRDARVGETAILAGWGKDENQVAATLRAGVATITAVSATQLQTTYSSNASSVCQGDSGGPLLLQESGVWALAGIISANSTLACSYGADFYTNVRDPDVSNFILSRVPNAARR